MRKKQICPSRIGISLALKLTIAFTVLQISIPLSTALPTPSPTPTPTPTSTPVHTPTSTFAEHGVGTEAQYVRSKYCDVTPDPPALQHGYIEGKEGLERLMSRDVFGTIFGRASEIPACSGAGVLTYEGLRDALASEKFNKVFFTGDYAADALNLAAFLALTVRHTHARDEDTESGPCPPSHMGCCLAEDFRCVENSDAPDCPDYATPKDPCEELGYSCAPTPGKKYFARGAGMILGNMNYAGLSSYLFDNSSRLLDAPEEVASLPVVAWQSGLWAFMTVKKPGFESVPMIMAGKAINRSRGAKGGFGLVMYSQGRICPHSCFSQKSPAENSLELVLSNAYIKIAKLMGVKPCRYNTDRVRCYGLPKPGTNSHAPKGPRDSVCSDEELADVCQTEFLMVENPSTKEAALTQIKKERVEVMEEAQTPAFLASPRVFTVALILLSLFSL